MSIEKKNNYKLRYFKCLHYITLPKLTLFKT